MLAGECFRLVGCRLAISERTRVTRFWWTFFPLMTRGTDTFIIGVRGLSLAKLIHRRHRESTFIRIRRLLVNNSGNRLSRSRRWNWRITTWTNTARWDKILYYSCFFLFKVSPLLFITSLIAFAIFILIRLQSFSPLASSRIPATITPPSRVFCLRLARRTIDDKAISSLLSPATVLLPCNSVFLSIGVYIYIANSAQLVVPTVYDYSKATR